MNKKIAFLFGAGVSIPSGLPKTNELTDIILQGENIVRLSGKYFYEENPEKFNYVVENEYINRFKKLFHTLHNNLGDHYSFIGREINYEDYYYMIDSLYTNENGEFENPLVEPFASYLFKVHASLFEPLTDSYSSIRMIDLMSEAKNYIRDLVFYYLQEKVETLSQFNILKNVCTNSEYSKTYIFTLNHDTLIEQFLGKEKLKYSDGFIKKNDAVQIWEPESFNEKIHLLKLHGSVNWNYYNAGDPYDKKVCKYLVSPRDVSEPVIMIGSFNKLSEYSRGINFDLQTLFATSLNECKHLIICGYSFGDQGINSRIINWFYSQRDRRIIVIHKNPEELFRNARYAIRRMKEDDISSNNKLISNIPKWIQDTTWEEIKNHLD